MHWKVLANPPRSPTAPRRKLQLLSENEAPGEERLDCSFPFCIAVIRPSQSLSTFLSSHPFTSIRDQVSAPVKDRLLQLRIVRQVSFCSLSHGRSTAARLDDLESVSSLLFPFPAQSPPIIPTGLSFFPYWRCYEPQPQSFSSRLCTKIQLPLPRYYNSDTSVRTSCFRGIEKGFLRVV